MPPSPPTVSDPAPPTERALTPAQRRALEFLATAPTAGALRSPMDKPDPRPLSAPPPPVEPAAPESDPLAGLSVTTFLGKDDYAVAMISHRARRIGDEVAPGWRIQAIDVKAREVRLIGPRDRAAVLRPAGTTP